ncbi:hypothetical protein GOBAR_DD35778 [Gossypium barbadense]|nr:hypothetical protein GOBAR_DD35778 [Gossypium barbadense]
MDDLALMDEDRKNKRNIVTLSRASTSGARKWLRMEISTESSAPPTLSTQCTCRKDPTPSTNTTSPVLALPSSFTIPTGFDNSADSSIHIADPPIAMPEPVRPTQLDTFLDSLPNSIHRARSNIFSLS